MSIEDDQDRFAEKMKEVLGAAHAASPDILVFCLRGQEIQSLLIKMAERAEAEAEKANLPENVRPIRPIVPPGVMGGGYMPPGYDEQRMLALGIAMAKERAETFRGNANTWRFLAAHVEEDRYFRLAIHDLAFLGLAPQSVCGASHFPIP
jgi:hypothetical protein